MQNQSSIVSAGLCAGLVALAAAFIPSSAAFGFTFAKDGKASATIVLPDDPGPSVRYAGSELAKYLGKITGASFSVRYGEEDAGDGPRILLGFPYESQKPEEVCVRLKRPDVLEITGEGTRGPLYAVYNLLEGLGCGFWTPEIETVPSKPTLALPEKFANYKYAPPFIYRQPNGNNIWRREWRPKVYLNGDMWLPGTRAETGGAYPMSLGQWAAFIPHAGKDEAFFAQRRDWLAFRKDGGRTHEGLCLTHPDLIAYIAQKIKEDQAKNPRLAYYNYSLADNDKYCQCKRCEEIFRKEGGASGMVLYGANAIGRLIAADAPQARMMSLAFWPTRQTPKRLKPEPNVFIAAAMLRDFTKAPSANKGYWDMLRDWSKFTKQYFFVWDYSCNFKSMLTPTPYIDMMGPTFRDYAKIGVRGVFSQMSKGPLGDFIDLRCWLFGKLAWNPQQDEWKLMDQWCDATCGKGATHMKKWLRLTKQWIRGKSFGPYERDTRPFFSAAQILEGYKLFQDALKVTEDDPVANRQIRKQYAGVVALMLTRYNFDLAKQAKSRNVAIPAREALIEELRYDIKAYNVSVGFHEFAEGCKMQDFMERIEKGEWLRGK